MPLSSSSLSLARGASAGHHLAVTPPDAKRPPAAQNAETVPSKRTRRRFSAEEKLRILEEADACERGELGVALRKYGIYSSHLVSWRDQLRRRGREGMTAQRPGPKPSKDAKDQRIAELEKKLARAEKKLSVAASVIEFQKKVSVMLGVDLDETSDEA